MSKAVRLLVALALIVGSAVLSAPAARAAAASSVQVVVEDVAPLVPSVSSTPTPMTFTVRVTNLTARPLTGVRILAERDQPIGSQGELNTQLAATAAPTDGLSVPADTDVEIASLASHATTVVSYRITTGTDPNTASLCLCYKPLIYPLYFSARVTGSDGSAKLLGGTRTFVPSMIDSPVRQQVGWLWPLIDRPHRLTDESVFVDDQLADSVGEDGRLDRALKVVEGVGATVPITLVIDPELLDELTVMATGKYTVEVAGGTPVAGSGQAAARAWLDRLATVLRTDAGVEVTLTPYADPDQVALTARDLGWTSTMPATMAANVTTALAGRALSSDLAWPSGGVIDGSTLRALTAQGVSTVVLDQSTLRASQRHTEITRVHLGVRNAQVDAAITSPAIQRDAAAVVTLGAAGVRSLPQLLAQIAVRSVQSPTTAGFVAIAPPRYVDASPEPAIRAIRATSTSLFSTPVPLRSAIVRAGKPGFLAGTAESSPLSRQLTDSIAALDRSVPEVADLLVPSTAVTTLLTQYRTARQRITSAAWRPGVGAGGAASGISLATRLTDSTAALIAGVHIVTPSGRNYTLASKDSTLPIAVRNDLSLPVRVRVDVRTVDDLPGLDADPLIRTIDPHTQLSFRIKVTLARPGTIPVVAQLSTPGFQSLGPSVRLTIHSTALGRVGIVITAIAGVVLVVALLVRLIRRTRRRTGPTPPVAPVPIEREPAS